MYEARIVPMRTGSGDLLAAEELLREGGHLSVPARPALGPRRHDHAAGLGGRSV